VARRFELARAGRSGPTPLILSVAKDKLTMREDHPRFVLLVLVLTAVVSVGLCVVAILAPAPAMAVPVAAVTCVGAPIFAAWEAPAAIARLRGERSGGKAVAALHQCLKELPEAPHPLGF
jgi:hypothetical protein